MRVEVKICGLTRPEDARAADMAGASLLGVVFAGGPRQVTVAQAHAIRRTSILPLVAVVAGRSVPELLRLRDEVEYDIAQLHDGFAERDAEALAAAGVRVWQVWRIADEADLARAARWRAAEAVLVEARVPQGLGGTGQRVPLPLARAARERLGDARMVLAGGLAPGTVAEAVTVVRPQVVDVSSGVEERPGVKDHTLIRQFVEAARGSHARP